MESLPLNILRTLPQEVLKTGIAAKLNKNDLASFRSTNKDLSTDPDLKDAQHSAHLAHLSSVIQSIFPEESTSAIITGLTEFKESLQQTVPNKSDTEMTESVNTLLESLGNEFWENHAQLNRAHTNQDQQAMQACRATNQLIFVKLEMLRQECLLTEVKEDSLTQSLLSDKVESSIYNFFAEPSGGISLATLHPVQNLAALFSSQPTNMKLRIEEKQSQLIRYIEFLGKIDPPANSDYGSGNEEGGCVLS